MALAYFFLNVSAVWFEYLALAPLLNLTPSVLVTFGRQKSVFSREMTIF